MEANVQFVLITNPIVGSLDPDAVWDRLVEPSLGEYDHYLPALYVGRDTTVATVNAFLERFANLQYIIIYRDEPRDNALLQRLLSLDAIVKHVFVQNRTSAEFRAHFAPSSGVVLSDCFERRDRNADYPDDEFFSDSHVTDGASFADYSIVGSDYSDTGGPAYAVALHHVYFRSGLGSAFHVRHFVSERTETPVDPGGKFLEALQRLTAALPEFGSENLTPIFV